MFALRSCDRGEIDDGGDSIKIKKPPPESGNQDFWFRPPWRLCTTQGRLASRAVADHPAGADDPLRHERSSQGQPVPRDLHVGDLLALQRRIRLAQEGYQTVRHRPIHPPLVPNLGRHANHVPVPDVLGLEVSVGAPEVEVHGDAVADVEPLEVIQLVRVVARDVADGPRRFDDLLDDGRRGRRLGRGLAAAEDEEPEDEETQSEDDAADDDVSLAVHLTSPSECPLRGLVVKDPNSVIQL